MIHCPLCHRLRRPVGLHICLSKRSDSAPGPTANGAQGDPATLTVSVMKQREGSGPPRHISNFRLPGDGSAAQVWNQLRRTAP